MRCLSLHQPWASLLVHGKKRVETRSWPTRHRGVLLIHAAKKWSRDLNDTCNREPFWSALGGDFHGPGRESLDDDADWSVVLPFGAIVGAVNVVACCPTERVRFSDSGLPDFGVPVPFFDESGITIGPRERAFGDYSPGRFAWVCEGANAFRTPIPYRGGRMLFDVPESVLDNPEPA